MECNDSTYTKLKRLVNVLVWEKNNEPDEKNI